LDKFDPIDLYGKTKLEGEQNSLRSMILRASIIGIEKSTSYSLLSWLLSQPKSSEINGFSNHFWNGVTTLHFGRIVSGIITSNYFSPGIAHVVPGNVVSKYQILQEASRVFDREDLHIREFEAQQSVNRSLTTIDVSRNDHLWSLGGYNKIPKVEEMILDYASWFKSNQKYI
jgi:dTDP-4-dehydrorhamnose reductase